MDDAQEYHNFEIPIPVLMSQRMSSMAHTASITLGNDCLALQAAMSVMAQPTKRQSFSVSAHCQGYRCECQTTQSFGCHGISTASNMQWGATAGRVQFMYAMSIPYGSIPHPKV